MQFKCYKPNIVCMSVCKENNWILLNLCQKAEASLKKKEKKDERNYSAITFSGGFSPHEDGQKYTYTLVQLLSSMSYDFVG